MVAHGDHGDRLDRLLEPVPPNFTPLGDERAEAEFADGDGCQKDLLPGHALDMILELGATPAAQRSAEDTRVDNDSHASTAAANASSSSSVRSSISNESSDASTGADAS